MDNKISYEYKAVGRLFRGKRPVGFRLKKLNGGLVDFNREATAALLGYKKLDGLKASSKIGKTFADAQFAFLGATDLPSIQIEDTNKLKTVADVKKEAVKKEPAKTASASNVKVVSNLIPSPEFLGKSVGFVGNIDID